MDKYETGTTHNFKRIKSTIPSIILKTEYLITDLIIIFQEPVVYMNGESFTPRFPDK